MAWSLSAAALTAGKNAYGDAVVDLIDGGSSAGTMQIRTGTKPATPGDTATGTLLATITFADPAFGSFSSGAGSLTNPNSVNAVATGTAGYARILDSNSVAIMDGTVTATGGGGDVTLGTVSLVNGQPVDITGGTLTVGS